MISQFVTPLGLTITFRPKLLDIVRAYVQELECQCQTEAFHSVSKLFNLNSYISCLGPRSKFTTQEQRRNSDWL